MIVVSPRLAAFAAALSDASVRLAEGDAASAFALKERAHVLGQLDFGHYLTVRLRKLRVAWSRCDGPEVRGQLLRIALTPFGRLLGRLPRATQERRP